MFKTLFFILIFFTKFISYSYAQLSNSYSIDIAKQKDLTYILDFNLYENGKFILDFTEMYIIHPTNVINSFGDAQIIKFPLYQGEYKLIKDTLILFDSFTHIQLVYLFNKNFLLPIKTFPFLKRKAFIDHGHRTTLGNRIEIENTSIDKRIKDFEKINLQNNKFEDGVYVYQIDADTRFEIVLSDDKTYEFCFKSYQYISKLELCVNFSSGTWKRNGNILKLWDTHLQHTYYGLIWESGIEFLFFHWEDVIYVRNDTNIVKNYENSITRTNYMNIKIYLSVFLILVIILLSIFFAHKYLQKNKKKCCKYPQKPTNLK